MKTYMSGAKVLRAEGDTIILMSGSRAEEKKQELRRVAVGPGNVQCMSIRQVSLRRGTCGHCSVARRCCCACCYCSAAADAAVTTYKATY